MHPALLRHTLSPIYFRSRIVYHAAISTAKIFSVHKINMKNQSSSAHSTAIPDASPYVNSKLVLDKKFHGDGIEGNIWIEFMTLAAKLNPVNLAIGFPDYTPAHTHSVLYELAKTCTPDSSPYLHQYARGYGHPRLVNALATLYGHLLGRQINPMTEVIITVGAFGALYDTIMSFVGKGDEVIIIEPFFDRYESMITLAGGTPVHIALKPTSFSDDTSAQWTLDLVELESLLNENTKAIILNNPNNPLGKVFTRAELQGIADLCKKYNILVISDEVYEWLVFDDKEHVRIAELDGMWERTVTIGSAGKMFSLTGWRLGWAYGAEELIRNLQVVHHNSVHTCTTPLQEALGAAVELEIARLGTMDSIFQKMPMDLVKRRDMMVKFIQDIGMVPIIPEGGCFVLTNWRSIEPHIDLSSETDALADYRFVKWLAKSWKILGIPTTPFYSAKNNRVAENFVRFCFLKKIETLQSAETIFKDWKHTMMKNAQSVNVRNRN